MIEPSLV